MQTEHFQQLETAIAELATLIALIDADIPINLVRVNKVLKAAHDRLLDIPVPRIEEFEYE